MRNEPKSKPDNPVKAGTNKNYIYEQDIKSKLLSGFVRVRSVYIISSLLQILFGLKMVTIALLGLISPIWVAALVNVFGCLVVVVGAYQLYDSIVHTSGHSSLIKESIRNVIDFRN